VAVSGSTAVVGNGDGSACLFTSPLVPDTQGSQLEGSNPATGTYFGTAVAVAGNLVVAGNQGLYPQSVYAFQRP
jgi:hypothetical protein